MTSSRPGTSQPHPSPLPLYLRSPLRLFLVVQQAHPLQRRPRLSAHERSVRHLSARTPLLVPRAQLLSSEQLGSALLPPLRRAQPSRPLRRRASLVASVLRRLSLLWTSRRQNGKRPKKRSGSSSLGTIARRRRRRRQSAQRLLLQVHCLPAQGHSRRARSSSPRALLPTRPRAIHRTWSGWAWG